MKKSLIAIAFAVATVPFTFAAQTPAPKQTPANPPAATTQTPSSNTSNTTTTTKTKKHSKHSKKTDQKPAASSTGK